MPGLEFRPEYVDHWLDILRSKAFLSSFAYIGITTGSHLAGSYLIGSSSVALNTSYGFLGSFITLGALWRFGPYSLDREELCKMFGLGLMFFTCSCLSGVIPSAFFGLLIERSLDGPIDTLFAGIAGASVTYLSAAIVALLLPQSVLKPFEEPEYRSV